MLQIQNSKLVYQGKVFRIEFYVSPFGKCNVENWLESQPEFWQHKFASLFVWMADHGNIFNERKFKHLEGTEGLFEFKANDARLICFFFVGKRLILTHGFLKRRGKTPPREIDRAEIIRHDFLKREGLHERKEDELD